MDNLGAGQGRLIGASAVVSVPGGQKGREGSGVPLSTQRDAGTIAMWWLGAEQGKNNVSQSNSQSWEQSCRALAVLSAGG